MAEATTGRRRQVSAMGSECARRVAPTPIESVSRAAQVRTEDLLAVEEPLQIQVSLERDGRRRAQDVAITMRTPGNDAELAAGFLFSEGILESPEQVLRIRQAGEAGAGRMPRHRVVVDLKPGAEFDSRRSHRHFTVSSSCGICGKTSIESLRSRMRFRLSPTAAVVDPAVLYRLPPALRQAQSVFERTGGLHAAALFDFTGNLLSVQEDVGRHNAVDKLIGREFLRGRLPLGGAMALVSGRASFELAQKALMAGIPILLAVGAPSSLAVETALRFQMTLVGFLRQDRFNVYSGAFRLRGRQAGETR